MKRAYSEVRTLQNAQFVIGRTIWDKACVLNINPKLVYYPCNETLRPVFYTKQWNIESCEKFSIFVSQGSYPIKGLHFMLEALNIIKKSFPEVKLYIAGENYMGSTTIKQRLRKASYQKFIESLIREYNLEEHIFFTGQLNEVEMCSQYLKSHVFVCPSTIENSPNSLGEAMILGVPIVSSFVGGIPDLIIHNQEGFLYQHDAFYMLAHHVMKLFDDEVLCQNVSENTRKHALQTHNVERNIRQLVEIYEEVHNS